MNGDLSKVIGMGYGYRKLHIKVVPEYDCGSSAFINIHVLISFKFLDTTLERREGSFCLYFKSQIYYIIQHTCYTKSYIDTLI